MPYFGRRLGSPTPRPLGAPDFSGNVKANIPLQAIDGLTWIRQPKPSENSERQIPFAAAPISAPSFPRKRESRGLEPNPAIRNQAQTAAGGSLLPSWEKVRMRVSRAFSPRPAAIEPAIRNQAQTAASGSLLPLWEKARMRVSRASSPRRRQSSPPYEIKHKQQPADPFSLYGRRLG